MYNLQKVNYYSNKSNELKYAVAYWYTLSDKQQQLIYEQSGWY